MSNLFSCIVNPVGPLFPSRYTYTPACHYLLFPPPPVLFLTVASPKRRTHGKAPKKGFKKWSFWIFLASWTFLFFVPRSRLLREP